MQPDNEKPKELSANFFPVVGIGASAGGLDAFKKLLKAIPEDSGMAFVLVQHLDPNHESLLPEILQKVTKVPVIEITDDIKVLPDHIYVIPSNKMMVATDGVLLLAPRPPKSKTERNLPIDLFFTSLAEVHQEHAIGVVLSGTASDGTQGLKAIKDHGGITFAQDEASAEYDSMPNSAVQAGVVDFILPPEKIPQKLLEVINKIALTDDELKNIPKQDEDVFKQILSLLRIRKGVDFTYYKQSTIRRRILRRMVVNKNEEPGDYLKFLRGNNQEQDLLYQDMLIPVTSFFRDKKVFEHICNYVFPAILKNKTPGDITRIWVAGCSTGQEVYSFAICFKEFLGDNHERIQIFGTDLSEPAIAKARTGMYEKSEVDNVSADRLKNNYTKTAGGYRVNKNIRDMCVFAHHNFLKDPPFGKMDCISCRNVLIYMEPYLQKKALTTFHYALNPKGFLLLGKSETTGGVPNLFAAVEKNDKLYTRKDVPGRFVQVTSQRSEQILSRANDISKTEPGRSGRTDFQKTADDILLTKYTPAGVVVNEAMDIVHFRGNTSNYLEQAPGKPSHNLLMMAKNGLGFELRNILHKAKTEKGAVVKENIPLSVNGTLLHISIEAVPLPNTLEPHYLILFHDNNLSSTGGSLISNKKKVLPKTKKEEKDIQIQLLEHELAQAREDMRSITENQEASNEELQSANEELLSGSEELQSLNEELETSKEELQSTNEELTVLNHELVSLNEQVTDARNYAESIVATLYQPLLVLDKYLRVKTANKAFYKTFKVNEQETEGVLIYELGNRQWNIPELRTLLEEILPQKTQITDYEVTHNFSAIGERRILLNALEITREKKEEKLILLSIEDITERKRALRKIEESEKRKAFLLKLSDALKLLSTPQQIKINAMQVLGEHLNASRCYYAEVIKDGEYCVIDNSFSSGIGTIDGTYRLEDFGKAKVAMLQRGEAILTADVANDTSVTQEERNRNLEMQIHAYINVPLVKDKKLICLLGVNQSVVRNWTELELAIVLETAERTWAAVERAKADEDLQISEEKYRTLFTSIDQGFTLCEVIRNKEGKVIDMYIRELNPTYEKQTGVNREMVLDKPLIQVFPSLNNWLETYASVVDNQRPVVFEHYFDDTDRWFTIKAFPVEKERFAVLFSDITERKKAEEKIKESEKRFRQMAELMPQKVWTSDADGNKNYFNRTLLDYAGKSIEELKGTGWEKIMHPEDWEKNKEQWEEALRTGKNYETVNRLLRKDGVYLWHLTRAVAIKDENDKIKMWVGSKTEIQEQRAEKEVLEEKVQQRTSELSEANILLLQKNEELVKMNKELESFNYISSHDLQEPLRKIRTFANRILGKEHLLLSEKGIDDFSRIQDAASRMQTLIEDLLAYSRTNITDRQFENTNLNEIVEESKKEFAVTIEEKKAVIETIDLGNIYINSSQFKQLMNNLIGNALKFSKPDAPPHIIIKSITAPGSLLQNENPELTGRLSPQKEYCHISISDNGIGFDPQYKEQIFDVFQRLYGKDEYPGTGIGLAIVKKIVENHSGIITTTSELDKGATFDIYIPA